MRTVPTLVLLCSRYYFISGEIEDGDDSTSTPVPFHLADEEKEPVEAGVEKKNNFYKGICTAKAVDEPLKMGDPIDLCIMTNTGKEPDSTEFRILVDDYASLRVTQSGKRRSYADQTGGIQEAPQLGEIIDQDKLAEEEEVKRDRYMWLAINNERNAMSTPYPGKPCHVEHNGDCNNVELESSCNLLHGMCAWNSTATEEKKCFPFATRLPQVSTCIQKYGDSQGVSISFTNVIIHMEDGLVTKAQLDNSDSACRNDSVIESYTKLNKDGSPDVENTKKIPRNNICDVRDMKESGTSEAYADEEADLKVFVSFTGTDRDGAFLKSSQLSYSRFDLTSIKSIWADMKDKVLKYTSSSGAEEESSAEEGQAEEEAEPGVMGRV